MSASARTCGRRTLRLGILIAVAAAWLSAAAPAAHAIEADFVQIAAGGYHSVALKADGTVWAWGADDYGQLGDDATLAKKGTPVQVAGLTDVRQVTAGFYHSLALKTDGTVWAWGNDFEGELGDDATLLQKPTPVQVSGLTNVRQVAAGDYHSLAVLGNGTAMSWGYDGFGQLGDDAPLAQKPTPVAVSGLTNVLQIDGGTAHSLALLGDGTVRSWGRDNAGQLGDDAPIADKPTPVTVTGLANVLEIAAGGSHSLALKADGTAMSWGRDTAGQLGDDAPLAQKTTPVAVATLTNVKGIAAGFSSSSALLANGTAQTWGSDSGGMLGDDVAQANKPTPVPVAGLANAVTISVGVEHMLAKRADGTLMAWGYDGEGELGNDAAYVNQPTPVAVLWTVACGFVMVDGGRDWSVSLRSDGTVWSWGDDSQGNLGDGAGVTDQPTMVQVPGLSNIIEVVAGGNHGIALRADGVVFTWGDDADGEIGDGAPGADTLSPFQVPGLANIRAVGAGGAHSLVLEGDGTMMAWGDDVAGQLGDAGGGATDRSVPTAVITLTNVREIAGGMFHSAAIEGDGTVSTWGRDTMGQLGDGTSGATNTFSPAPMINITNARHISAATNSTLMLKADGLVWAVGINGNRQLGDNTAVINSATPVQTVGLPNVLNIAMGSLHGMATKADGTMWTWGGDGVGQVGNGAPTGNVAVPTQLAGITNSVMPGSYDQHSLLTKGDGTLQSWGADVAFAGGGGALGDNIAIANQNAPVTVALSCAAGPVTISGNAYADELGTTAWSQCNGAATNIHMRINGAISTTSCAAVTGAFTFTVTPAAADSVIVIFMNPAVAGDKGVLYTRNLNTTSNISGLVLTKDRIRIRSESATNITNAAIDTWDSNNDTDIPATSDGTNLTTAAGNWELHVDTGETYAPGGNVTVNNLHLEGTYTGGTETLVLTGIGTGACTAGPGTARPLCIGAGSFTAPATTRYSGGGALAVQGTTYSVLNLIDTVVGASNYTLGHTSGATITATALTIGDGTGTGDVAVSTSTQSPVLNVSGNLSVTASSSLAGTGTGLITVNGSVSGAGLVNLTGGSFLQMPTGAPPQNFGSTGGTSDWTFNDLTLRNAYAVGGITVTVNAGGTGKMQVLGTFTLGNAGDPTSVTLNNETNDRVFDLDGNFVITNRGAFTASSTALLTLAGNLTRTGSFSAGTGTLTLDTTATSTLTYAAATTFSGLTINGNKQVNFDNVDQTNVTGALNVTGTSCALPATLRSDSVGVQFELNATGSRTVSFADVRDANVLQATTANNSVSSGNNSAFWTINNGVCSSNAVPNTPSNLTPLPSGATTDTTPLLTSSAFSDPDVGNTHNASQWQIRTDAGNYASPAVDSGTDLVNLTSFTSTVLANGTYWFQVRHRDNNLAWSTYSAETKFFVDTVAPTTIVTLGGATPTTAWPLLTWTAATDATSGVQFYRVFRAPDNCNVWTQVSAEGAPVTNSFTDTTAIAGNTYCYKVRAVDFAGNAAADSNIHNITFNLAAAPTAVKGTWAVVGNTRATVTWERSLGSTSYRVYRSTVAGAPGAVVGTVNDPDTSFVDTGLSNGPALTYYYTVRGYNGAVESGDPAEAMDLITTMPTAAHFENCNAFIDGKTYLFGGATTLGTANNLVWQFDPVAGAVTDTFMRLPANREDCAASDYLGKAYILGGGNGTSEFASILRFTPGVGITTQNAVLPTARWEFPAVTMANGMIYALGGENGGTTRYSDILRYDPVADTNPTVASNLPGVRSNFGATSLAGNIITAGGVDAGGANTATTYRDVFIHSPESHTPGTRANTPATGYGMDAIDSLNDKAYLFCGSGALGRVRQYDDRTGASGTWTTLASTWAGGSCTQGSAQQIRGFVYGIGGDDGTNMLNQVYRFSPGGQARAYAAAPVNATAPGALATFQSGNDIALSWVAGTNVHRYRVFRSTTPGVRGALVEEQMGLVDAPTTTFTDKGLAPCTTYYYTVDALGFDDRITTSTAQNSNTTAGCVTISGFAYEDETGTVKWSQCNGIATNIAMTINGGGKLTTACNNVTGAFSFTAAPGTANQLISIYLEPAIAGDRGVLYTRNLNTSANIAGLILTKSRITTRSESATSITNAAINIWDTSNDTDIPAASDGTNLITAVGNYELHVDTGETFAPGGNVTVASMHLEGTYTGGTETLVLNASGTGGCTTGPTTARPLCIGAGTFTAGTNTTRFTGSADSDIQGATYNVLQFHPSSGTPMYLPGAGSTTINAASMSVGMVPYNVLVRTTAYSPNINITGNLTVDCSSTLDGTGTGTITVNGSANGCGWVYLTGGTFHQRVSGAQNFGFNAGGNTWRFNDLRFSNSNVGATPVTVTVNAGGTLNTISVNGTLWVGNAADAVGATTTLNNELNDRILNIDGNVDITTRGILQASSTAAFTVAGNFTRSGTFTPGTGTVTFDGATTTQLSYAGATTFSGFTVSGNKQVTFDNVDQTNITGAFNVTGTSCAAPATLRSDSLGVQYEINATGSRTVSFADVRDANILQATTANSSVSAGNNSAFWTFNACNQMPTAPTHVSLANGSTTADTTPTLTANFQDPDAGNTGTLTFEVCTVAMIAGQDCVTAGGAVLSTGSTAGGIAIGSPGNWTSGVLTAGTRYWHVRGTDNVGGVGTWSASWTLIIGAPSMTVTANLASVALTPATVFPGQDATASSVISVTTNNATGYTLTATDESDTWGADQAATYFANDWTGTNADPTPWAAGTGSYWGFTVRAATGGTTSRMAKWGTGTNTTETDYTNNEYTGLDNTVATTVHVRNSYYALADTVTTTYRMTPDTTQRSGAYNATVTYTGTANP